MTTQSWCKIASNLDSHPKIRRARAMGREVFLFALRKNAEPNNHAPGRIAKAHLEPWYIADQIMRSEIEALEGLNACVHANLLREEGDHYLIVGWDEDEWGREKSTERVRKWREHHKTNTVTETDVTVSKADETFHNVSKRCTPPTTHNETDETARGEERRGEEIERDASATPPPKAKRVRTSKPKTSLPADWIPRPDERAEAASLGVNCDAEAARFRDYQAANGKVYADHDAAFRNWLRNAQSFGQRNGSPVRQEQPRNLVEL